MADLFDIEDAQNASKKFMRIKELSSLIKKYQRSYYNGEGEISDAEFDRLWDELKILDPKNPILTKVGQDSGDFAKARHIMPMGSQEKAADPEQFLLWAEKHVYPEYLVEYKLDGASLELQYENGVLIRAVTRGDGVVGDDISANARKMQGVKALLRDKDENPIPFTGGVRGEVIMTHEIHKTFFSDKANCRNAANGLMRRKDGAGSENLKLITYDAFATGTYEPFFDEKGKIAWLTLCGFNVVPLKICRSPEEVIAYRSQVMEMRKNLEYDIDGLVIKDNVINLEDAGRARPDRQIAFKFSLEEAVSVLRAVEWSESGATYTPVAVFDPVEIAGTTVQRASLSNPDTIRALNIFIGSHVTVVKRGEIIPKIETAFSGKDPLSPIEYPKMCSSCRTSLVDEGSRLYCPNKDCPKRVLHRLMKWISVADIRDLGETLISALFDKGIVGSISDIYKLTPEILTPFFLNEESIASNKTSLGAQKVWRSINSHKTLTLPQFIAGFDIEGIGEANAEKLVSAGINTLEKMLDATQEQMAEVYGFADIMARTAAKGLAENKEEMLFLVNSKTIELVLPSGGKLAGKSFCFTGELVTIKRADAQNLVKQAGGSIKSSVTKDLSYLVTNDTSSGSSKNIKAASLGIPVISEKEFFEIVRR
ncbi:NAD-dependent DNA ligase LigA [Treponema parvum]|uniref:DNA ligase n=1 Tax=Treponema parvum TaxID=138851 RepID=A0A975IET0_9SPIR|nr:NAD-dependent DNA ligase LigA [Treponema parvum]QTQ14157.1 NAD-dependent DNA ligase LigA [Treponema parvum]